MSERDTLLRRWTWAAAGVGLPMGALSAFASWALRAAFEAEHLLGQGGLSYRGGPSALVLLMWAGGGYIAAIVGSGHLGIAGWPGVGFVASSAALALLMGLALYPLMAGNLPDLVCARSIVCAGAWILVGGARAYIE